MTWHGAFMMIPINIGQFQIKYRSVAVELSVRNLHSLVKSVFGWSVGYLLVGWSLRGRMSYLTPPHYSNTQLQLSSTPNHHAELLQLLWCYSLFGFRVLAFSLCINIGSLSSIRMKLLCWSYSAKIVISFAYIWLIRFSTLEVHLSLHVVNVLWPRLNCS